MAPSNQHSDEEHTEEVLAKMLAEECPIDEYTAAEFFRAGALAGRESKQHTDREHIKAIIADARKHPDYCTDEEVADAILAAPSLSLVAARDEVQNLLWDGFENEANVEQMTEALFDRGIVTERREAEADALEAAEFKFTDAEWREYQQMPEQGYSHRGQLEFFVNRDRLARAARVRSGKAEA